jgi:hypothetical protein
MPKGILEFDLDDKFEKEKFELAVKSVDFYLAVSKFAESLRKVEKYGSDDNPNATELIRIETVRASLHQHLDAYDVHLSMLS